MCFCKMMLNINNAPEIIHPYLANIQTAKELGIDEDLS